jgi:hypothetical protein
MKAKSGDKRRSRTKPCHRNTVLAERLEQRHLVNVLQRTAALNH